MELPKRGERSYVATTPEEVERVWGEAREAVRVEREQRFVTALCSGRPGRFRRWLIARCRGLRCLVCNRRAGYGGTCPNSDHNA